jgi:hypothetical protein
MTSSLLQCFRVRLAACLLAVLAPALAAPGHDQGDEAVPAAGDSALPRFVASSDLFELVGLIDGNKLTLYLDHAATNEPVKDAKLELEIGGKKIALQVHAEGEFEATLAQPLALGVTAVTASVATPKDSDLLAGEIDLHEAAAQAEAAHVHGWQEYAGWGLGATLTVLALVFVLRRLLAQRASRNRFLGGAA